LTAAERELNDLKNLRKLSPDSVGDDLLCAAATRRTAVEMLLTHMQYSDAAAPAWAVALKQEILSEMDSKLDSIRTDIKDLYVVFNLISSSIVYYPSKPRAAREMRSLSCACMSSTPHLRVYIAHIDDDFYVILPIILCSNL
jgi:hypothetical protein